ncbi:PREDICTED: tumor necrosis factor receptor superfamily member 16-like [Branchiostoma belcheri]|uniref:Tumor necrosis factor receptor superfamily member 16-like n=1 Tax=Branchiostoma belcheri TaxID=7741 RepID=A0A6P4Z8Z3_BRABE|nr:PREDICTED: tumor necrosis factor receptor superfamily member 16-like [Branchiostoma belcheri]
MWVRLSSVTQAEIEGVCTFFVPNGCNMQLKEWSLISLLILAGLLGAAAVECDDQHHLVNGLCCIKCLPGFYKDKDCDAESPTKCLQCPGGTYTEFLNYIEECLVCEHCSEDHGIEEKRPCLPTQNRKCRCMDGFFLEPSLILGQNADMCHRHQECQPGEGVVERGTRTSDTVCTPCAVGTFSDQGSRTQKCEDWTDCESLGLKLIIPGTTDRDTVCGYEFLPSTMSSAKTAQTPVPPTSSSYATVSVTSVKDAGSAWQTKSEENGHATTSGNKHTDHRGSNHTIATVIGVVGIFLIIVILVVVCIVGLHLHGYLQCAKKKCTSGPGITYRNSAYSPVTDSGDTVTVTNESENGRDLEETACKHVRGQWPTPPPAMEAPHTLQVPAGPSGQNEGQEQQPSTSDGNTRQIYLNVQVTNNSHQVINNTTKNTTVHDNSTNVQDCGTASFGNNNTFNVDTSMTDSSTVTKVEGNSGGVQIGEKNTM